MVISCYFIQMFQDGGFYRHKLEMSTQEQVLDYRNEVLSMFMNNSIWFIVSQTKYLLNLFYM